MGDLLQHLVLPGSQESFHTANSDSPPSPLASSETTEEPRLTSPRSENPCSTATIHTTALQAAGLPVFDINEYLSSPATQAILDSSPPRQHKPSQHRRSTASKPTGPRSTNPTEPVQLGGPKTSYFVSQLNTLCQARGLRPVFEILEQDGGFGGKLFVGGERVEREGKWATKKEAREKLAESGVEVVRSLTSPAADLATNNDNWIGRLQEYHTATATATSTSTSTSTPSLSPPGPIYTDFALGPLFASEVVIPSHPTHPFGNRTLAFPSKKSAKSAAAREAVQWLIQTGELNADGTLKRRKKQKLGVGAVRAEIPASSSSSSPPSSKSPKSSTSINPPSSSSSSSSSFSSSSTNTTTTAGTASTPTPPTPPTTTTHRTFAHRVNALYPLLGLSAPEYRIQPTSTSAPNFHTGAAFFPNDGLVVQGPVAEVRSVFGKKNAREECAKGVLEFLERLARGRGVDLGGVEGGAERGV